jgi:hypothetical protein
VPNEFGLLRPSADGRPAPTEKRSLRRRRPTLGASRLKRPISIGEKAFSQRSACADRKTLSASAKADAWRASALEADFNRRESLRPTLGLRRPRNVACVGEGRRLARRAWKGRFQSAGKPSANGRPAPTEERRSRRRRPTPGAQAPEKADFNRREGLQPTVGLRRPRNVACVGEGRRLARKRLERPISIGAKAFGQRPACADRKTLSASAKADAWRGVRRMNSAS